MDAWRVRTAAADQAPGAPALATLWSGGRHRPHYQAHHAVLGTRRRHRPVVDLAAPSALESVGPGGRCDCIRFLLPYILWNIANGLPTWEFWHHYGGITGDGPLAYLANQIFLINPFTVPVAILGLVFFFRSPQGKSYRVFGWAYVFLYVLFTLIQTKSYFLAPAYPPLFAGGALMIERAAQRRSG